MDKQQENQAQPEKLVIQCPECQTRFAIAPAAVRGVDSLKFHCSRCDNVFTQQVSELKPKEASSAAAAPPPPAPPKNEAPQITQVEKSATQEKNLSIPKIAPAPQPAQFEEERPIIKATPVVPPAPAAEPTTIMAKPPPAQSAFDDSTYQTSFKFPSGPTPASINTINIDSSNTKPLAASALEQRLNWIEENAPTEDWRLGDRYILTKHSGGVGFLLLASPLVGFLLLLGALGWYLGSNPMSTQDLLRSAVPSLPIAAPEGVIVRNTNFNVITMENGEELPLVTGKITNSTDRSFDDVQIEAHVFDKSGNIIDHARIGIGNGLAQGRIRALSREMIAEMQQEAGPDRVTIKPGESREFAVALLDRTVNKASFFSARIYSVREKS